LVIAISSAGAIGYSIHTNGAQSHTESSTSGTLQSVSNTTNSTNVVCPEVSHNSSLPGVPFGVLPVGQKFTPGQGTGNVTWCIYNNNTGILEASYVTDRQIDGLVASADGSYVVMDGQQIESGPSGASTNGEIYLFSKDGQMRWSLPTLQYAMAINGNGSVIVANNPDLLYINNHGEVLWNYSNSASVALVNNGSEVVDGISQVTLPGYTNFGSEIILFNSLGRAIWNVSIPNVIFDSTASIAVSNGYIAAGVSYNGSNGTMLYYNLDGTLIWSRHASSAIQQVDFEDDGSAIFANTNWGNETFDLAGNVIQNQTSTAEFG